MTESFPRQEARTRRFSLGAPRAFHVSPDGARVVFLRTRGGADPVTCLWVLDVADGRERLVADPRTLVADTEDLPPQERDRRLRDRPGGHGGRLRAVRPRVRGTADRRGPGPPGLPGGDADPGA